MLPRMTSRRALLLMCPSLGWSLPKGVCDCHTHIFGDPARFPMWPGRAYTPPTASPAEMAALHRRLGVDRVVIVTPSVYGSDNAATLFGIKSRGKSARGVVVIDDQTPSSELKRMSSLGVVGVRVNAPRDVLPMVEKSIDRVASLGWHVQVFSSGAEVASLEPLARRSPVPLVIDHVAGIREMDDPSFAVLRRMLEAGHIYVKVSNRFLAGGASEAMVRALLAANPDRILWGTDWPHPDNRAVPGRKPTDVSPFEPVDDAAWLNRFLAWGGGERQLVANPARLYRF